MIYRDSVNAQLYAGTYNQPYGIEKKYEQERMFVFSLQ